MSLGSEGFSRHVKSDQTGGGWVVLLQMKQQCYGLRRRRRRRAAGRLSFSHINSQSPLASMPRRQLSDDMICPCTFQFSPSARPLSHSIISRLPSSLTLFENFIIIFNCDIPAGFAGDDAPRSVFPSLIGRARQPGIMVRCVFIPIAFLNITILP